MSTSTTTRFLSTLEAFRTSKRCVSSWVTDDVHLVLRCAESDGNRLSRNSIVMYYTPRLPPDSRRYGGQRQQSHPTTCRERNTSAVFTFSGTRDLHKIPRTSYIYPLAHLVSQPPLPEVKVRSGSLSALGCHRRICSAGLPYPGFPHFFSHETNSLNNPVYQIRVK